MLIYGGVYLNLRRRIRLSADANHRSSRNRINRAALYMFLYPLVYVVLTLPNASGRMYSMANPKDKLPVTFYIVAGSFFTSCGWVDSILYAATRRVLVRPDMESPRDCRNSRSTRNVYSSDEFSTNDNTDSNDGAACINGPVSQSVTISASRRKSSFSALFPFKFSLFRTHQSHHAPATLNMGSSQHRESSRNYSSFGSRPNIILSKGKCDFNGAEVSGRGVGRLGDVIRQTTFEVTAERNSDKKKEITDRVSVERKGLDVTPHD